MIGVLYLFIYRSEEKQCAAWSWNGWALPLIGYSIDHPSEPATSWRIKRNHNVYYKRGVREWINSDISSKIIRTPLWLKYQWRILTLIWATRELERSDLKITCKLGHVFHPFFLILRIFTAMSVIGSGAFVPLRHFLWRRTVRNQGPSILLTNPGTPQYNRHPRSATT